MNPETLQDIQANNSFINEEGECVVLLELDDSQQRTRIQQYYYDSSDSFDEFQECPTDEDLTILLNPCKLTNLQCTHIENTCTQQVSGDDRYPDSECSLKLLSKSTEECLVTELQALQYEDNNGYSLPSSESFTPHVCNFNSEIDSNTLLSVLNDQMLPQTLSILPPDSQVHDILRHNIGDNTDYRHNELEVQDTTFSDAASLLQNDLPTDNSTLNNVKLEEEAVTAVDHIPVKKLALARRHQILPDTTIVTNHHLLPDSDIHEPNES